MKRDVKKKPLPRPEGEKVFVSRSSPLSVIVPSIAREVLLLLVCHAHRFHFLVVPTPIES
jgi:hypothetical protein